MDQGVGLSQHRQMIEKTLKDKRMNCYNSSISFKNYPGYPDRPDSQYMEYIVSVEIKKAILLS